ncbi:hypothetical protein T492DRAFT_864590 [Pavlovales sp. CCMP2436]|nr:hypothetical protein T492DRAFT_864590 [Pavlovales sp. CCMP2436]
MGRPSVVATAQYLLNPFHSALGTRALRLLGAVAVALPPAADMSGKVCLVTGGTQGIGRSIAAALASAGAEVHITGRNEELGKSVATELGCKYHRVDHGDIKDVNAFVGQFVADSLRGRPLHCLINNVARMFNGFAKTSEGHESACALNLLGFYRLTTKLLPSLRADTTGGRCVTVTSAGMLLYSLDVSELRDLDDGIGKIAQPYDAVQAYSVTHRSRVLLTQHWGEEEAKRTDGGAPVRFASVHPGWVETPGLAGADAMAGFYAATKRVLRTAAQGADTPVWFAAGIDGECGPNGAFYWDRKVRAINLPLAGTAESPGTIKSLLEFCAAPASGACSRPTPVAKLAAIGAHEEAFSNDQSMPRRHGLGRRHKGGSRQLELAAACQARQAVGKGKYASKVLDEEVVDDDAVDNLNNVHNDVEADIVTVRNREASKQRMTKMRAKRKRAAATNVAAPTVAALPSGTSAFSPKHGEPRKTEHAAEVAKSTAVQRIVKAASHLRCSATQQGEALECALNQVNCRGLLEDRGLAAPEASRLAADIIGNVRKTLERVQPSKVGPLTKVGKQYATTFAIAASSSLPASPKAPVLSARPLQLLFAASVVILVPLSPSSRQPPTTA